MSKISILSDLYRVFGTALQPFSSHTPAFPLCCDASSFPNKATVILTLLIAWFILAPNTHCLVITARGQALSALVKGQAPHRGLVALQCGEAHPVVLLLPVQFHCVIITG